MFRSQIPFPRPMAVISVFPTSHSPRAFYRPTFTGGCGSKHYKPPEISDQGKLSVFEGNDERPLNLSAMLYSRTARPKYILQGYPQRTNGVLSLSHTLF